jgi:peptidoglycan hydrolase CwlO-like protein
MKTIAAVFASLVITGVLGFAMFTIGANAILNKNTVALANSPSASSTTQTAAAQDPSQAQIQQLQALIDQYKQRDQEYQTRLNQAIQQINQDNSQIQTYQQVLLALQERGLILIRQDGTILLPSG